MEILYNVLSWMQNKFAARNLYLCFVSVFKMKHTTSNLNVNIFIQLLYKHS